jgi:hypothetical protein
MKIFALWDKGRAEAPDIVRRCLDRWEELNPGHDLVVLDRDDLEARLGDLPGPVRDLPIQGATNVLRTRLLAEEGGVWTDATVLPILPIDDWLPGLLEPAGFFAFAKPGRARPLASWFLAAQPGSPLPRRILQEILAYWDRPRSRGIYLPPTFRQRLALRLRDPRRYAWSRRYMHDLVWSVRPDGGRESGLHPYHWYHYLVGWLLESDPEFRAAWERMPCRSAIAVHNVQRSRVQDGLTDREFGQAVPHLLRTGPVQKLNWRLDWPEATFERVPPAQVAI